MLTSLFSAVVLSVFTVDFGTAPQVYPLPADSAVALYSEQIFTTHDGLKLHGHLAVPRRVQRPPVILLLAGSGLTNRYENAPGSVTATGQAELLFKPLEDQLLAQGFAVFTYDKRGIIPSDNTFLTNSVTSDLQTASARNLAADAIAAFDHLKSLPSIDASKISVLGHSEGTILGLKTAEQRPEVHSLILLGLFTRGMERVLEYQAVTAGMRIMGLIDSDQDGYLEKDEVTVFHLEAPQSMPSWAVLLGVMDYSRDGKIARSEQQFYYESLGRELTELILNDRLPWPMPLPRAWFQEYYREGSYRERFAAFCAKIHVFHGEADMQTPFEDALELREICERRGTPLASFSAFADLGHGFSPRIGLKGWKDTVGPIDSSVILHISEIEGLR